MKVHLFLDALRARTNVPKLVDFAFPHPQPRLISHYTQGGQNQFVGGSVLPVDPKMLSRILLGLKQPGGKLSRMA